MYLMDIWLPKFAMLSLSDNQVLVPKRRYEHKLRVFYLVKRWQIAFCQQRGKRDIEKAIDIGLPPNGHEKVERFGSQPIDRQLRS